MESENPQSQSESQLNPTNPQAPESTPAPVSRVGPIPTRKSVQGQVLPPQEFIDSVVDAVVGRLNAIEVFKHHSGPLPDPDTYREYAQIIPDGAERIMKLAEDEAAHRRAMEKAESKRQDTAEGRAGWGIFTGAFIALVGFGTAYLFALNGHSYEGALIATGTLIGLVSVFVIGSATAKNTRIEELKEIIRQQKGEPDPKPTEKKEE